MSTDLETAAVKTVRAQDDLFRHVNGPWLADKQIPEDRPAFGAFEELRDDAEQAVREIIETAATAGGGPGSAQLIGDLYRSFMDTDSVESGWAAPVARAIADVGPSTPSMGWCVRSGVVSGLVLAACSSSMWTLIRVSRIGTRST